MKEIDVKENNIWLEMLRQHCIYILLGKDAEFYAKYDLTEEKIAFIESMIKTME